MPTAMNARKKQQWPCGRPARETLQCFAKGLLPVHGKTNIDRHAVCLLHHRQRPWETITVFVEL